MYKLLISFIVGPNIATNKLYYTLVATSIASPIVCGIPVGLRYLSMPTHLHYCLGGGDYENRTTGWVRIPHKFQMRELIARQLTDPVRVLPTDKAQKATVYIRNTTSLPFNVVSSSKRQMSSAETDYVRLRGKCREL